MDRFFLLLLAIALVSCKNSGSSGGTTVPSCTTAALESDMTSLLSAASSEVDFTYSIERSDARKFTYSRGTSSLTTSYESASTSKLVTAVIILRLVDQGVLHLTDTPQSLISGWPIVSSDSLYPMTLANLLSFTSGLESEAACINIGASNFENCAKTLASTNAGNGVVPGSRFYYSSSHMQVAGLMAIKAKGYSSWQNIFSDFKVATGLFANSTYDLPSSTNPRLAGGMHWTGSDYLAFLKALKGGSLLSSAMMSQLLLDQTASAVIANSPPYSDLGEDWHYGLGIWHECQSSSFNCTPAVRVSSPGAYGAYPFWDRGNNYFGMIARQGALGTYPNGIAIERVVRSKAEQWSKCTQ